MSVAVTKSQFDPESFARNFYSEVLPGILHARTEELGPIKAEKVDAVLHLLEREDPEEHAQGLIAATKSFAPPFELAGAAVAYQLFVGMVALRASTRGSLRAYPQSERRHRKAATWICVNFGELIWWNCD